MFFLVNIFSFDKRSLLTYHTQLFSTLFFYCLTYNTIFSIPVLSLWFSFFPFSLFPLSGMWYVSSAKFSTTRFLQQISKIWCLNWTNNLNFDSNNILKKYYHFSKNEKHAIIYHSKYLKTCKVFENISNNIVLRFFFCEEFNNDIDGRHVFAFWFFWNERCDIKPHLHKAVYSMFSVNNFPFLLKLFFFCPLFLSCMDIQILFRMKNYDGNMIYNCALIFHVMLQKIFFQKREVDIMKKKKTIVSDIY